MELSQKLLWEDNYISHLRDARLYIVCVCVCVNTGTYSPGVLVAGSDVTSVAGGGPKVV